jgi:hypothetical protein
MPTTTSGPFSVKVVAPGNAPAVWRKINVGVSGSDSWGSSGACVERNGQGRIFHYFNWMNIYDPVSNTWTTGIARGRRENYGSDHDTDNGVIWMAPGAPVADPALTGTVTYSVTTGAFKQAESAGGADAVYAWDQTRKVLYTFGGFDPTAQQLRAKTTTPNGPWVDKNPSGTIPVLMNDSSGYTHLRGGIDSRNGKLWVIGDNEEFYQYNPSTNSWSLVPTTGSKPPRFSVFMLDELHDCIVGHCGVNAIQGETEPLSNDTRILNLATRQWSRGPLGAAVCPPAVPQVAYIPLYDRVRNRSLILVYNQNTGGTDVWQLVWK